MLSLCIQGLDAALEAIPDAHRYPQKCFVRDVDDVLILNLWLPIPSPHPMGRGIVVTALSQRAIALLLEWLASANSIEKEHF